MQRTPIMHTLWRGPTMRGARNGDWLHVSDLIFKCVRRKAFSEKLNTPLPAQKLWDSQLITFATGERIGDHIVDKVKVNDGRLFGDWTCNCLDGLVLHHELQTIAEQTICNQCGHPHNNYKELSLKYDRLHIVGHSDVALMWEDELYLVEVKSANDNSMKKYADRPDRDHLLQLLFYWYLCKQEGLPVHDTGSILYVKKEWMIGNPYKEHVITFADHEHLLEPYLAEAEGYATYRETGVLPDRTVCEEMSDRQAKDCIFIHECFANGS